MAVQHSKAPGRKNQQARGGEENSDETNRQLALFAVKSGSDEFDEPRSSEDANQDERRCRESEKRENCTGSFLGLLAIVAGKKLGVDGNEGRGQNAFAEKILQKIGNADGGFEGVGGVRVAEIMGEEAVANEAGNAAEEYSGGDEKGGARGAKAASGSFVRRGAGLNWIRNAQERVQRSGFARGAASEKGARLECGGVSAIRNSLDWLRRDKSIPNQGSGSQTSASAERARWLGLRRTGEMLEPSASAEFGTPSLRKLVVYIGLRYQ